jgi:predicted nuclease of predicted toxin-antitoxin system
MRFLVDAQLPPALARFLQEQGHEAGHVEDVGLREAEDDDIWNHAVRHGLVVITKDEDFVLLAAWKEPAPRIVWIRVGNCSNCGLLAWFKPLLLGVVERLEGGERVIEIV